MDCLHILHLIGGHVDEGNENNKARGAANKYQEEARRGNATRRLTRQRQRHYTSWNSARAHSSPSQTGSVQCACQEAQPEQALNSGNFMAWHGMWRLA